MADRWKKLAQNLVVVQAHNELHRQRGQFLAVALVLFILANLALIVFSIPDLIFRNQPQDFIYVTSDLIVLGIVVFAYVLNRKGYTKQASLVCTTLLILQPFVFPLHPVELTLLLYALPLTLASFTIGQGGALICTVAAISSFEIQWIVFENRNPIEILPALILALFGFITWLIASRWEQTLLLAQEFQTKYQLLVDELPGVAYLREPGTNGRWLYCSPQIDTLLGIKPNDWIDHPEYWLGHVFVDDRARVLHEWQIACATAAPFNMEYRMLTKGNQEIWVRENATVIHVPDQPSRYQGIIIDISERKHAEQDLRRDVDEMASLTRMSREITSVSDLNPVLESIAYQVTELLHSDAGGVYGLGEDGRLRILATHGIGERYIREVNAEGIAPELGVIGRTVRERRPVAVANVFDDPNYQLGYFAKLENIFGVLAAPMLRGNKVSGVIVAWHRKPHKFSEHEIHLLQAIAQQCVNAVENARLLEAEREQRALAEALRDTANAFISTTSPEELYESILENLKRVVPYDAANIMRVTGDSVHIICHHGYAELGKLGTVQNQSFQISQLAGLKRMMETHQPIIIPDVHKDTQWMSTVDTEWIQSFAGVPIRVQDQIIGFINIDSGLRNFFSAKQIFPLQAFANQAALAIDNARLLAETEQRAAEFTALYETTRDLATMQDVPTLLETLAQRAVKLLHCTGGGIYLYDDAQKEVVLRVRTEPSTILVGTRLKLGQGMAGRVAQTRQPFIVDDYQTWEHRSPLFDGIPIHAILQVPMLYGGELIGVLAVQHLNDPWPKFTPQDAQVLSLFASQGASAVRNARLFAETRQRAERLGLLNRIARHINESLDLNSMLEKVYRELGSIIHADGICIALYDPLTQELDFRILTDRDIRADPIRRPVNTGLSGLVASRRQPLLIRDYELEKEQLPPTTTWGTGELPHSWLGVPILADDQLVGIMNVQAYDPNFSYDQADQELLSTIADTIALAINNARLFQEQARRTSHLEILNDAAIHTQQYLEPGKIFQVAVDQIRRFGDFAHVFLVDDNQKLRHLHTAMSPRLLHEYVSVFGNAPSQPVIPLDIVRNEWEQLEFGMALVVPDILDRIVAVLDGLERRAVEWLHLHSPHGTSLIAPLRQKNRTIGIFVIIGPELSTSDIPAFSLFARQVSVALDNARLFQELRDHSQRQEALYQISARIAQLNSSVELCNAVTRALRDTFGFIYATIFLVDEATGDRVLQSYCGWQEKPGTERLHPGQGVTERALQTGTLHYYADLTQEPMFVMGLSNARSEVDVPLRIGGKTAGILVVEDERINAFSNEDVEVLQVVANQLGVALEKAQLVQGLEQELVERKRAEEQAQRQVERLASLHSIDTAISSSLDLNVTLEIILDQVTTQLRIDAADILRLTLPLQILEFAAARGFHSRAIHRTRLPLGKEHAGRAAYERRTIHIPDLSEVSGPLQTALRQHNETFVTYFAFPLIAKGEIKGVLELYHRTRFDPDQSWLDFAETLAAQTAIALDNMALFDRLQKTNTDLILAYDTTLEGWSRALELRDMETQGHSVRVAELTMRLARAIGINESELVNIRHGALLHDIGKMGIPDSILMKPGPLTEDEWVTMRNHPVYAYQLLSRIPYLRPAIDIPYAHHEHWDGGGYPRALKGDEIPLPARIFAVIDVWDAMRSERPYHKAWSEERVREHILNLSGKQFEPRIVEAFLNLDLNV